MQLLVPHIHQGEYISAAPTQFMKMLNAVNLNVK